MGRLYVSWNRALFRIMGFTVVRHRMLTADNPTHNLPKFNYWDVILFLREHAQSQQFVTYLAPVSGRSVPRSERGTGSVEVRDQDCCTPFPFPLRLVQWLQEPRLAAAAQHGGRALRAMRRPIQAVCGLLLNVDFTLASRICTQAGHVATPEAWERDKIPHESYERVFIAAACTFFQKDTFRLEWRGCLGAKRGLHAD